jgi:hypothetical protein
MTKIVSVVGREILDSRGNPTVEAESIRMGMETGSRDRFQNKLDSFVVGGKNRQREQGQNTFRFRQASHGNRDRAIAAFRSLLYSLGRRWSSPNRRSLAANDSCGKNCCRGSGQIPYS